MIFYKLYFLSMYFTIEAIFSCPSTEEWRMLEIMRRIVFATNRPDKAETIANGIVKRWLDYNLPTEPVECSIRILPYLAPKFDGFIIRPIMFY